MCLKRIEVKRYCGLECCIKPNILIPAFICIAPHCGLVFASQKTTERRTVLGSVFEAFRYGLGNLRKRPLANWGRG